MKHDANVRSDEPAACCCRDGTLFYIEGVLPNHDTNYRPEVMVRNLPERSFRSFKSPCSLFKYGNAR